MRMATVLLVIVGWAVSVWAGGFSELAREGRWAQILELARIRAAQLPLKADEAFVAAEAARHLGDRELEARYLEMVSDDHPLAGPARVRLAGFLLPNNTPAALTLALEALESTRSPEVRRQAVGIIVEASREGLSVAFRRRVTHRARHLPRRERRRLQLALATGGGVVRREDLRRLLQESVADLPALEGARALLRLKTPTAQERWLAARSLYRHAAYEEAAPLLEKLAARAWRGVPVWRVLYLRGRCEFRLGRWRRAVQWYRRAEVKAPSRERLAELEVHVARALELAGDLEGALHEAGSALRHRPSDERRLFLLRLALRAGQGERARTLVRRLRRRTARDRGRVLFALAARRQGDPEGMVQWLSRVRRRPWRGPACVLAAQATARRGESSQVLRLLERAAEAAPSDYWNGVARRVIDGLPPREVDAWRASRRQAVADADSHRRRREIDRWAALETDPGQLTVLQALTVSELGLSHEEATGWRGGLAQTLWRIGLKEEAARWDPSGFPGGSAAEAAWSAPRLLANGAPRSALRHARAVLDRLGWHAPPDLLPLAVQRALFPLSWEGEIRKEAAVSSVPWSLLAALVREESRWDPNALSAVGARGLTQLMPATAAAAAAADDVALPEPHDLFEPEVSLRLGAAELARLLGEFRGRRAPAVAAYNAGEAQARLWLEECGANCTEEWYVLGITFSATRRYTEDVLAAARRYEQLYGRPTSPSP